MGVDLEGIGGNSLRSSWNGRATAVRGQLGGFGVRSHGSWLRDDHDHAGGVPVAGEQVIILRPAEYWYSKTVVGEGRDRYELQDYVALDYALRAITTLLTAE